MMGANLAYRLDREWGLEEPDEEYMDLAPIAIPMVFGSLDEYTLCSEKLRDYMAVEFSGTSNAALTVREAFRHNIFLLLAFGMGRKDMEHPWLLARCNEVQESPDGRLDLWAREHYKSTIITLGLTVQDILKTHGRGAVGQECCIGIFSHTRPIAKDFLRQIKTVMESNDLLKRMFPDILYQDPKKESPRWADEAILVKRKNIRSEATVEAWGLVDSQPTSKHFTHRIYDDVVTDKSVSTEGQIEKTTRAVQMSDNLGAEGGVARFIGTTYAYKDTYSEIRKTGVITREYPGRAGGTEDGAPVFRSEEWHLEKRRKQGPYVYSSQILIKPVPAGMQVFKREWIRKYDTKPEVSNRYIFVDPANSKKVKTADYTVMWVFGLVANRDWYLLDGLRDRLSLTERADRLFDFHRKYEPLGVYYQEYGMEADRQHMEYRQDKESYRFEITPVHSRVHKDDRIRRLIPMYENSKIWRPKSLHKTDHQGVVRDLVEDFIEQEYAPFPMTLGHDDMLDTESMLADPDIQFVAPRSTASAPYRKPLPRMGVISR